MNSQHVGRKNGKTELHVDRRYSQMLRTIHFFSLPLIYLTLKCNFLAATLYLMRFIPQITSFQGKHVAAQWRSGISHLNN